MSGLSSEQKNQIEKKIKKQFSKKPLFNRITRSGFNEFYTLRKKIRKEDFNDVEGDFADLLEVEGKGKSAQLKAIDKFFKLFESSKQNYDAIREQLTIMSGRSDIPTPQLLEQYNKNNPRMPENLQAMVEAQQAMREEAEVNLQEAEARVVAGPRSDVVAGTNIPKPPPPVTTQTPLPKPSLRGSGGAGTPRVKARVKSVTPRKTPKQAEPIDLPPSEQPPPTPPALPTIPENDNPLSVPIPQEVEPEPSIPIPREEEPEPADPMTPPPNIPPPQNLPPEPMTPLAQPAAQPALQPQQSPNMATQTEPNVSQEISRKVTSVSNEEQPSKIDLIPKERLSAENKTEAELFDDINYFYKTFPNELKNITFDRNNRNIEYLKSKHKEIVAKLTAGKKKEEKIGIIISGSDYIKEKLKEIILENSINGLSAKDLIINVEKRENEQSSDVNSYEFKMGADGKAMAKKEPIYKYIPEVVQQPIKTKPSRIPNTQTKFRSLVTTARREVANNPFTKPQPKIRLKYTY
jgi:hypothetical protein